MEHSTKTIYGIVELLKQKELLECICNIEEELIISDITYFSGSASAGSLFICKGAGFKEEYLREAAEKGIACYMSEKLYDIDVPAVIVSDIRKAMSLVSAYFCDNPHKDIRITGVTGTKGKTTTVFYIKKILDTYTKSDTALLSTAEINIGDGNTEAHLTTPESLDLQKMIRRACDNGMKYLTMEVSSQAYKHNRVYGIDYDIGVFMNIDEDHIGPAEHENYEDYLECKIRLVENCRTAVIMRDIRDFERVRQAAEAHAEKVVIIGNKDDDYCIETIEKEGSGFSFELVSRAGSSERYTINQEGRFNIKNAVCAIAVAKEYGVPYDIIAEAVRRVEVPGRMNVFQDQRITVIVDYAHNRLSFAELFESLKSDYPDAALTVVCGSGGARAQIRRKDIGILCGKYADKIYLTAEDPQFENPRDICSDIARYIDPYKKPYVIIENRVDAIENAIRQAEKGDIIIVAGKGEEAYQKVNGRYEHYESDISVVRRMMGA